MSEFEPLADDETLLWEGRPDAKLRFGMETLATGIFAAALVLACLGLATVINRADPGTFWVILTPGLVIGAITMLAYPLVDSARRRKTTYRLSNKRAFINQTAYPIPPLDQLIYRNGTPPTIYFTTDGQKRQPKDIGFERISDARDVFIMMRDRAAALHDMQKDQP